jgi:hypothetical protein
VSSATGPDHVSDGGEPAAGELGKTIIASKTASAAIDALRVRRVPHIFDFGPLGVRFTTPDRMP